MKWLILESRMGTPEMQDENTGQRKAFKRLEKRKRMAGKMAHPLLS
jgi:hypothetical protein